MLRQAKEFVLASLAILLAIGLLTGATRGGYLLSLLVVAFLLWAFVPGGWKPFVSVIGTLFGVAVLGCFLFQLAQSLAFAPNDGALSLALALLSLLAYAYRKFRYTKIARPPRVKGAERTPLVPSGEADS